MSSVVSYVTGHTKHTIVSANKRISQELVEEIVRALETVAAYGSIEIYVQDSQVTQITVRNIKKTRHTLSE